MLREYPISGYVWNNWEDNLYRDGQLLANLPSTGQPRHFDLDHLGTPRLITNSGGTLSSYHVYYPFGEEATLSTQDTVRLKFTGHERDLNNQAGGTPAADDLDYMHARFYSAVTGRFLGTDRQPGHLRMPQTWNRYSYVAGNPLKYLDPNGQELQAFYLATGTAWDFARHSALYFQDGAKGSEADIVFSHGGMADGVSTLNSYLSHYNNSVDPTIAYQLNLPPGQAERLLEAFKSEWTLTRANVLIYNGEPYHELGNNCAQHVCDGILSHVEWDPVRGILIDVFTFTDRITPGPAVLSTNQALSVLSGLGILGEARDNLRSPRGAPKSVIYYWSYYPQGKK